MSPPPTSYALLLAYRAETHPTVVTAGLLNLAFSQLKGRHVRAAIPWATLLNEVPQWPSIVSIINAAPTRSWSRYYCLSSTKLSYGNFDGLFPRSQVADSGFHLI